MKMVVAMMDMMMMGMMLMAELAVVADVA